MTAKAPPIPEANLSPKGPGDTGEPVNESERVDGPADFDKQGQQGNSKINTTHQGYQQDR